MNDFSRFAVISTLLKNWALRPDSIADLKEIFGITPSDSALFLQRIKSDDFSWLPKLEILPAETLKPALAAYSRERATIYLSAECPPSLLEEALLEEIGHHIDAIFNTVETRGDEGSLFSAAVRGIELSDEEITAILNEDDSALLHLDGCEVAVECIVARGPVIPPAPPKPPAPPANDTITSAFATNLTANPSSHGLILTGSGNLYGSGNAQSTNNLNAAQNSGNTSLVAGTGTGSTTMVGGSGNMTLTGAAGRSVPGTTMPSAYAGTLSMVGGTGSSTMIAGSGSAVLIGGSKNNSLVAGTGNQSLYGGTNSGSSLYGNTLVGNIGKDTLHSGTGYNTLISGSAANGGNTLIGGGIASSLVAGAGNDSLVAVSGSATLKGGVGSDILAGGTGTNLIASGSTAGKSNTLIGGSGNNTLTAGLGTDSLAGGAGNNLLLITSQAQAAAFAGDLVSLATGNSAHNSLGINSASAISIQDSLFASMATQGTTNLGSVVDLAIPSNPAAKINLGANAEKVGVHTLTSGYGNDTLSVAGYATTGVMLDASKAVNRASLVGGGLGNDTFKGSQGGYDTMIGAGGNDLFQLQNVNFGSLSGGAGNDTIALSTAGVALSGTNFNNINNVEVLSLFGGNNLVGSLQGSGINYITDNNTLAGSDTLSANVVGTATKTSTGSYTLVLTKLAGATGTMGFATGQVVSGNGISIGTTITNVTQTPQSGSNLGTVILTLSAPTTSVVAAGTPINSWINNATLDGSAGVGLAPTTASFTQAQTFIDNSVASISAANYGHPQEAAIDTSLISALQYDARSYVHRQGDVLTALGQNESLVGANAPLPSFNYYVSPSLSSGSATIHLKPQQVIDNTLVSGAYSSNTLVGGAGTNLYQIINPVGFSGVLPTILNPAANASTGATLQSASTIQFTNNGVNLNDADFVNVGRGTAQKIVTANGNNLIQIGQNAASIGIQTIIGGVGSDTFAAPSTYVPSIYFDASKGSGNQSLQGGIGNDTLLAGRGNATIEGGDGNNSLIGGTGNNLIQSGIGNSTLDGGYGISTLQADGGNNLYVVRNRNTRILSPNPLDPNSFTVPLVGTVNSYVNFDPIQSTQTQQFAPTLPDGSPSITKSASFASSDISSFYNLQNFNLLGSAQYGVGNALDNSMTSAAANALMLGMGGNNTLVASGANASLYGFVNAEYASPDLYAAAPFDTRDQAFIDGVIGSAGNNSLVATGANSYLDGGPGYNDALGNGSGSNTMIGSAGNDTFVIRHQADFVQASGSSNAVISTVNLGSIADNVTEATLLVTNQAPDLPNIDSNTPTLSSNTGQTDPADYLSFGGATTNSTVTHSITQGQLTISVPTSTEMDVQYGAAEGLQYQNVQGTTPSGFGSLNIGAYVPDPNNPSGALATILSWSAPITGGAVSGYTVTYRTDDGNGNVGPWKTYVNGNSTDFTGTSALPSLTVDNLPTLPSGSSYDFQVSAQQLTIPTHTDPNTGLVSAQPVTLHGSTANDIILGFARGAKLFGDAVAGQTGNAPVLTNNPVGMIPVPIQPTDNGFDTYPVYMDGGNGNDFMVSGVLGNGDGTDYTVGGVTFSGLNTMVGGFGSDTFEVSNGTQNNFDQVIKYGNETPVDYTKVAPNTPAGISTAGVSLNGGMHNLVISNIAAIQLSDTTVSQGKFIDELLLNGSGEFGEGNRLDNFIYDINPGSGGNTLVGSTGRDSIVGIGAKDILIGGTETGLDNVGNAIVDFNNGLTSSIYRDTDPSPNNPSGPGANNPSQYWTTNSLSGGLGGYVYNYLGNSDTLISTDTVPGSGAVLDGGAGNDSLIGNAGDDTMYVSAGGLVTLAGGVLTNYVNGGLTYTDNTHPTNAGSPNADVVSGGGGNDWIVYTGSDVYWSGLSGGKTAQLGYALSNSGDSTGTTGQSISNILLGQNFDSVTGASTNSDPIARIAIGNATSTGNTHNATGVPTELGSNKLIGNQFGATLNGGGVGGTEALAPGQAASSAGANGPGAGSDTLIGNASGLAASGVTGAADYFIIGKNYTGSTTDAVATATVTNNALVPAFDHVSVSSNTWATDVDYAVINAKNSSIDSLASGGAKIELAKLSGNSVYLIGSAPTAFGLSNLNGANGLSSLAGTAANSTDFGIYKYTPGGTKAPNLVAEVQGIALGANLTLYTDPVGGLVASGQNNNLSPGSADTFMGGSSANYAHGSAAEAEAENFLGTGAFYSLTTNAGALSTAAFAQNHIKLV
jgi:Ca2+-binding RTX toxin-like protein